MTPAETAQRGLGHRNSVEDLRSIINTSLTARRWQSKTVSKALPALAPFVPRMLRDDLLTTAPKCLSGAASPSPHADQDLEDDRKPCTDAVACLCARMMRGASPCDQLHKAPGKVLSMLLLSVVTSLIQYGTVQYTAPCNSHSAIWFACKPRTAFVC